MGPEHPLTLDQMKVLYVSMGYQKTIDDNLQNMITTQKTRAAFIPEDFWDDLESSFKKIDYPTALLEVYKKYLSTEDAAKLIDFSKTEAGKHFLENLPETSRQVTMAIQKQQQATGMQVQARHKDEIDAALKKYREEHAPKPAPTPARNRPCGTLRFEYSRRSPGACDDPSQTCDYHPAAGNSAGFQSTELSTKGCMSIHKKPLVLAILDGWGYRAETQANAIALARKPTYDKLLAEFPNTLVLASDHFVGLPDGQMGNSEESATSTSARDASSTWTSPA